MTDRRKVDAKKAEDLAGFAEIFVEEARVYAARVKWNEEHPDARGFDLSAAHNRTTHAQRILAIVLNGHPLKEMDANFLIDLITQR